MHGLIGLHRFARVGIVRKLPSIAMSVNIISWSPYEHLGAPVGSSAVTVRACQRAQGKVRWNGPTSLKHWGERSGCSVTRSGRPGD